MVPLRLDPCVFWPYGPIAIISVCLSSFRSNSSCLHISSLPSPQLFTLYITFIFSPSVSQSSSLFSSPPSPSQLVLFLSVCLPQLCGHTARADAFDLSAVHVVEIWGLLHCQATGPVMERWRRRISHCSWCSRWMDRWRERGRELARTESIFFLKEKKLLLLNTAPGVKGEPYNLVVNPTLGCRGGIAAWESFADTGCRDVSKKTVQPWFPELSDWILK